MAKFDVNNLPSVKKFNRLKKKAAKHGFILDTIGYFYVLKTKPRTIARELFGHVRGGFFHSTTDLSYMEGMIEGLALMTNGLALFANIDYLHVREQMEMKATMDALKEDEP